MKRQHALIGLLGVMLLFLAACGGNNGSTGSSTTAGAVTVQVTETDFKIDSSVTKFVPGKAYHFVVTNQGQAIHEFMIMPKSEGMMNGMSMDDTNKQALAFIATINPGETKTLDYTFPASTASTQPELACYQPGHYEAGMHQSITVSS